MRASPPGLRTIGLVGLGALALLAALAVSPPARAQGPAVSAAERQRLEDYQAAQFILALQRGNEWPNPPTDAEIEAAVAAIPTRQVDGPDPYVGRTSVTVLEGLEVQRVHALGADLAQVGIHGNQVVLRYTARTVTTYPPRNGVAGSTTESTAYAGARLAWQEGSGFSFGPVGAGGFGTVAERDADYVTPYADGWLLPGDEQVTVEGFDGTDGSHGPLLFRIAVTKDGKPAADRLVGLQVIEGQAGLQRRVGWFAPAGLVDVAFDEPAGTSLDRPIKTGPTGEVWVRLYADFGAIGTSTVVPRTVALQAWVPRQASEGKDDRPARFEGVGRVVVKHAAFLRGVRLQLGRLQMRYPDTPMGTWEVVEDQMIGPWQTLAGLPDPARADLVRHVTLDGVPLKLPDNGYRPVDPGARLIIDLGDHHREFLGAPGDSPPPRDGGSRFYPARGDKVGVVVEWLDGTVAMFVARSRPRGPSALAVKLAPAPVVYGAGPKLMYFLGVESIQYGVEVVVERLLVDATGVGGLVATVGYMLYQFGDKTSDAVELLSIASGDGTFVVLNSVVAQRDRETGGSELYTLQGAPALERADGSQVEVPREQGVVFTAGGDIEAPAPGPVPAWAEANGRAVRDLPRGLEAPVALGDVTGIPGIEPIAPEAAPAVAAQPARPPAPAPTPTPAGDSAGVPVWVGPAIVGGMVLVGIAIALVRSRARRRVAPR